MIQVGDLVLVALAEEVHPPPALQRETVWHPAVVLGLRTAGGKPIEALQLDAFPVKCRRMQVVTVFLGETRARVLHLERDRPRPSTAWDAIRLPAPVERERLWRDPVAARDAFRLARTALGLAPARAAELLGIPERRLLAAEEGEGVLDWDRSLDTLRRGARTSTNNAAASVRIPWGDPRLEGLYPHHANGATYLCADSDGAALGVVWGDGSGTWYKRIKGPAKLVADADIVGPLGWQASGNRVVVERDGAGWYWVVRP